MHDAVQIEHWQFKAYQQGW